MILDPPYLFIVSMVAKSLSLLKKDNPFYFIFYNLCVHYTLLFSPNILHSSLSGAIFVAISTYSLIVVSCGTNFTLQNEAELDKPVGTLCEEQRECFSLQNNETHKNPAVHHWPSIQPICL